ncbi:MAG: recombination protein O N-terminal domain-containing protein, partial [Parachlamydiaceae bacterium]
MDFVSREFRFKGVVLSEFAYGERDRIVSIFTPQGLYRAIEKFGKKHNVANFSIVEGLL